MKPDADVIIAGAGPAGTLAAFDLCRQGFRVMLIEKEIFPRYKVCGAGLTHKILAEIPFSLEPVLERTIYHVRFSCHFSDAFTRRGELPLMYCTGRPELDAFLLKQAEMAGTRLRMGEKILDIRKSIPYIEVVTTRGIYRSRILMGADGAAGIVARSAGLKRDIGPGMAWEAEIAVPEEDLAAYRETIFLDWGTFPGGYGWIFPKKDHFSAGVGGPASLAGKMKGYYRQFIRSTGIKPLQTHSFRSWPIPVRLRRGAFHAGNILVAGDAAGLTDPLTGEGIWYAVKSGRMAAACITEHLRGRTADLARYSSMVNETLMYEIETALKIRNLFNAFPLRIHHLVSDNDRVWKAFGKILRGERYYRDVRGGFGKYAVLWSLICHVSAMIYRIRRWRAEKVY